MQPVLNGQNFDDVDVFVDAINKARLANKNSWITYDGLVAGKALRMKNWNTGYLQIFEVDGIKHSAPMDMKVGQWKDFIQKALTR